MNLDKLKFSLQEAGATDYRYFHCIGSTNDEALAWAAQGAPDGAVVVADEQTKGRGRLSRKWITRPGAALAFSVVLRPSDQECQSLQLFSALAALAVQQALAKLTQLPAEIKWPNDVLVNGKKLCGILVETVWMETQVEALVVGIGVNVASSSVPPAKDLLFPATCVEAEAGHEVQREELLTAILDEFFDWRKRISEASFLDIYCRYLAFKGRSVKINMPGDVEIAGKLSGVNADGSLLVEIKSGEEICVVAGDLRLRPE